MLKKMTSLLMIMTITASLMLPSKKAEAGIIIGSPAVAVLAIIPFITGTMTVAEGSDFLSEKWGWTLLGLGFAAGILDNNTTTNQQLNTIPSYLLQEIQDRALLKSQMMKADQNGIKEVIFTNEEVDEIFELADENTSIEQMNILRQALTHKVI